MSPQWSPSLRFPHQDPIHPLSSPIRATCPPYLILLDLITRTILGEEYKSFSSSLCNLLHSPVTSTILVQIFSSTPCFKHPQRSLHDNEVNKCNILYLQWRYSPFWSLKSPPRRRLNSSLFSAHLFPRIPKSCDVSLRTTSFNLAIGLALTVIHRDAITDSLFMSVTDIPEGVLKLNI